MGIVATGATAAEVFEQVALGMMAIVTDVPAQPRECVAVGCAAPDHELLLVDWLNALIFEMATRRLLFGAFSVRIASCADGWALQASAWGETVNRERHHPAVELKGATYTALDVHCDARGLWHAQCVVDV